MKLINWGYYKNLQQTYFAFPYEEDNLTIIPKMFKMGQLYNKYWQSIQPQLQMDYKIIHNNWWLNSLYGYFLNGYHTGSNYNTPI